MSIVIWLDKRSSSDLFFNFSNAHKLALLNSALPTNKNKGQNENNRKYRRYFIDGPTQLSTNNEAQEMNYRM